MHQVDHLRIGYAHMRDHFDVFQFVSKGRKSHPANTSDHNHSLFSLSELVALPRFEWARVQQVHKTNKLWSKHIQTSLLWVTLWKLDEVGLRHTWCTLYDMFQVLTGVACSQEILTLVVPFTTLFEHVDLSCRTRISGGFSKRARQRDHEGQSEMRPWLWKWETNFCCLRETDTVFYYLATTHTYSFSPDRSLVKRVLAKCFSSFSCNHGQALKSRV